MTKLKFHDKRDEYIFREIIKRIKDNLDNPSGMVNCSVMQIHRIIDRCVEELKND